MLIIFFFLSGYCEVSVYPSLLAKCVAKVSFEVQIRASPDLSLSIWIELNTWCGKVLERILSLRKICWILVVPLRAKNIWMCLGFTLGINTLVTHLLCVCYRLNMTFCMKRCMFVAWKNGPVQFIRRSIQPLFLLYSSFFHWCWWFFCTLKLAMNSGLRNGWEMLQFFKPFMGAKCLKYQGL